MLRFILGILMGAAAVIFAAQNTDLIQVDFLVWQITMSRSLMILIVLFFGIVIGWVVGGLGRRRNYR